MRDKFFIINDYLKFYLDDVFTIRLSYFVKIPLLKTISLFLLLAISSCSNSTTDTSSSAQEVLPLIEFTQSTQAINENAGTAQVQVRLQQAQSLPTEVHFVMGGTATNGSDYNMMTTSPLVFSPGETIQFISISINDDDIFEGSVSETIILTLANPSSHIQLGAKKIHTLALVDNDIEPAVMSYSPVANNVFTIPTAVVFTYSKSMESSTITNLSNWTFLCTGGGIGSVTGVVLSGTQATVSLTTTIQPSAGSNCTLTALTGQQDSHGNSLAGSVDSRRIIYTKVDPASVVQVSSSASDGWYKAGDLISVQVIFSETVTVSGGSPQLTLETGGTDAVVELTSGSGTTTLAGTFTVQAGYASADLNYETVSSLQLNGSSIISQISGLPVDIVLPDLASNQSLAGQKEIKIDTVLPTVASNITDGQFSNSVSVSPTIIFTSGTDALSGILRHEARIKRIDNSIVQDWTLIISNSQRSGLTLTHNTQYFVELRAVDQAGNVSDSITSDGWWVDTEGPNAVSGISLGVVPNSLTQSPTVTWSSAADVGPSLISHYQVQVLDSTDVVIQNWTTLASGSQLTGLNLINLTQYYFKIRAVDVAGNFGATLDSGTWQASELADPCSNVPPDLGAQCADGTFYIGEISGVKYFTTPGNCEEVPAPNRAGTCPGSNCYPTAEYTATCNGAADTLVKTWNNESPNWFDFSGISNFSSTEGVGQWDTNTDDNSGSHNTTEIIAQTNSAQGGYHASAHYCDKMQFGGKSDWFLPNRRELDQLRRIGSSLQSTLGVNTSGSWYWSSSENTSIYSWIQRFNDGSQLIELKYSPYRVRCFRKN